VNNLSSAVRPTHTVAIVSLLEESLGCFEYDSKTKARAWTEESHHRGPEAFRATDKYQRDVHQFIDIHNVIHREFV